MSSFIFQITNMLGKDAAHIKHIKLLIWKTLVRCAIKAQLKSARTFAFTRNYTVLLVSLSMSIFNVHFPTLYLE